MTVPRPIAILFAAALVWAGDVDFVAANSLATRVLVVANQRVPESVRLAQYYAARRGVP